MINRMISAMKNDLTVYKLLKENSSFSSESIIAILIVVALSGLISGIANSVSFITIGFWFYFLIMAFSYILLSIWAWFVGTKLFKGTGTFSDVRIALAYAFSPLIFSGLPYIGALASLWAWVTISSAIRETLGIGKGLTFLIVVSAGFLMAFPIFLILRIMLYPVG